MRSTVHTSLRKAADRNGGVKMGKDRGDAGRFLDQTNSGPQLPFEFKSTDHAKR
jgi:hypothetical protein